jgi:hypothetical protein
MIAPHRADKGRAPARRRVSKASRFTLFVSKASRFTLFISKASCFAFSVNEPSSTWLFQYKRNAAR